MLSDRRKAQLGIAGALMIVALCVTVLFGGTYRDQPIPFIRVGVAAPNFSLPNSDGLETMLTSLRGKTVVLFFGCTNCPRTAEYDARVNQLARQYADDSRVQFLGINVSPEDVDVRAISHDAKVVARCFPTLLDEKSRVADLYSTNNTPQFIVIDPTGIVRYRGAFDDNADPHLVVRQYCAEVVRSLVAANGTTLADATK